MKVINCIQGTDEWFKARLGKITASMVHGILPGKKNVYRAARKNYMAQLIGEILSGKVEEENKLQSLKWIQHGKETECLARSAYEVEKNVLIDEVGFIISDEIDFLGCSPDGLLNDRGIEIKCPNTATHIESIVKYVDGKKKIFPAHYTQMQVGMICTGFKRWDYISYDNRLPGKLQIYIDTIDYDSEYCELIKREVKKFWEELQEIIEKLRIYMEGI